MNIAVRTQPLGDVNPQEVREVLLAALLHERQMADARRASYARACQAFERQYLRSSEQFMHQFEAGELGDDAAYFDWFAAKRGLDIWEKRARILAGVSV
jgi:hypothetical protein